jgi:hypothetical protein
MDYSIDFNFGDVTINGVRQTDVCLLPCSLRSYHFVAVIIDLGKRDYAVEIKLLDNSEKALYKYKRNFHYTNLGPEKYCQFSISRGIKSKVFWYSKTEDEIVGDKICKRCFKNEWMLFNICLDCLKVDHEGASRYYELQDIIKENICNLMTKYRDDPDVENIARHIRFDPRTV